ncbi:MAG TPA: sigma-54 dependent transcriptional regulator [Acidobacteriaceae bacterium]|jgi:two-component system response regulator HydG
MAYGKSQTPSSTSRPPTAATSLSGSDRELAFEEDASAFQFLIADADVEQCKVCMEVAEALHFIVSTANSCAAAQAILARRSIDLLLLDLKLPGESAGIVLLEEVRARYPETVIVVMTADATVSAAVEAMRLGAADFLTKPFSREELATVLERSSQRRKFDVRSRALRERLRTGTGMGMLVGRSPAMEKLYRILSKVAFTTHSVLILGESGTGKELVARSIHANGPNASKPFILVECSSIAPALLENELFGYVKGAFSGAIRGKTGLLATAEGGTIFLDEIGELPLDLQARLLRALQEKEIRPVGSTQSVPIAARVLAASKRDLLAMVESGRFRKDLYYRLNVVNIRIPPLRDRRSDIPLLAEHILERLRRENGLPFTLGNDALHLLRDYEWSGNVRELENALERASALSSGPVLHASDFPALTHNGSLEQPPDPAASDGGTKFLAEPRQVTSIAELERQAILYAIHHLNGDKLMAARLLGIGKTTLYRKLKEYGLDKGKGGKQDEQRG